MSSKAIDRIGVLGGTFDPLHNGHLSLAAAAREKAGLSTVWFAPAAAPPHKLRTSCEPRASFAHRLRMAQLAVEGREGFEVTDREGRRPGPSFTVDVLREWKGEVGDGTELCFLIGSDWVADLGTWKEIDAVFGLCRFLVVPRPGFPKESMRRETHGLEAEWVRRLEAGWIDAPEIGISSTLVRENLASGLSITDLVPDAVEAYIRENGLYRGSG